ncbi:MAG: uridine kinase [Candidatus Woesearchaeota archaeon]
MAYLVAVAGISGSGKGTFAEMAEQHLSLWGLETYTFSTDDCYRDLSYLSQEERDQLCFNPQKNFDHPDLINFEKLRTFVSNLKQGKSFEYPLYDFSTHSPDHNQKKTVPATLDIAIIEGIYALHDQETNQLYDCKIFVDTDPTLAALRRIRRDVTERGRNIDHIIDQISKTVVPMQKRYVFPTKMYANEVINWRVDETKDPETIKKELTDLARQRALFIYEQVKGEINPRLELDTVKIPGID